MPDEAPEAQVTPLPGPTDLLALLSLCREVAGWLTVQKSGPPSERELLRIGEALGDKAQTVMRRLGYGDELLEGPPHYLELALGTGEAARMKWSPASFHHALRRVERGRMRPADRAGVEAISAARTAAQVRRVAVLLELQDAADKSTVGRGFGSGPEMFAWVIDHLECFDDPNGPNALVLGGDSE